MVDQDIAHMYDQIVLYIEGKIGFFEDPSSVSKEFNDFIEDFNLSPVVYNIQRQVKGRPTISEAAIVKAYWDIRATQAEYEIRLMDRSDYFNDAKLEETDNRDKWKFNKKIGQLHMQGKDAGA